MSASDPKVRDDDRDPPKDVVDLLPMVRRVVLARVGAHPAADDLIQETLTRVIAALPTIEPDMVEPYAITTARNLVASLWRDADRHQRNQHRVVDLTRPLVPDEAVVAGEEQSALLEALGRLSEPEREALLAHELSGQDTRTLAQQRGSTAGAVAAHLNRSRARLRVEYLLVLEQAEPPTDRCRPVLLALSSGDRRRQRELDVRKHLLDCELCSRLSEPLLRRGQDRDDEVRVPITRDADIVTARQAARELAAAIGFSSSDLTLVATAVSEVARNIVRFAGNGEIVVDLIEDEWRGVRVVARDNGPGIGDLEAALSEGYSTNGSLGLGLPGARRLMDEFDVESAPGQGTIVTMTKWRRR